MSRPVPGQPYTVTEVDRDKGLTGISERAYGDGTKWRRIFDANRSRLKSDDPNLIFPGEIIIIPVLAEINAIKKGLREDALSRRDPNTVFLEIEGETVPVDEINIQTFLDTGADTFSASVAWPLDDEKITRLFKAYSYRNFELFIGDNLVMTGVIYKITNSLQGGRRKRFTGFSLTKDMVDSTINPPYEEKDVTLKKRVENIAKAFGVDVQYDLPSDSQFKKVTAEPEQGAFDHVQELAKQRGGLVSSTPQGKVWVTQTTNGRPVGTLTEGVDFVGEFSIEFDGTQRFNGNTAKGQSPGRNAKVATAKDDVVKRARFKTFSVDDTTEGDIQKAAEWRRSKNAADATSSTLPVTSWYAPNGKLWEKNTLVTIESGTMECPNGFTFLIKSVSFTLAGTSKSAELGIVVPSSYTGKQVEEPWLEV